MNATGANWIADLAAAPVSARRPALGLCGDFGLRWVTYAQFWSNARRAAGVLAAAGIEPGSRILLWGPNTPEWVACLMGALLRGVVVVPLDVDSQHDQVVRIAAETSARFVWYGSDTDPSLLSLPNMRLEAIVDEPEPLDDPAVTLSMEEPAAILYTSGTTSEPRGVVLTHGNIYAQLERFAKWRFLLRWITFRILVIAPLSHVQGLLLGAFLPFYLGLSGVFVRSVHPAHLLRVIRDYRITLLSTVPRVLQVLTQTVSARPSRRDGLTIGQWLETERPGWLRRHVLFSRLNTAIGFRFWVILVGGAALPRYDEQFWRDTGRFVIQGYGLTETTAIVALNGPFSRKVGSIGRPLGNVNLKLADDGEILVRGATVTRGYFASSPQAPSSEYLRTGDLARMEKGRLFFLGRKKEMIVTGEGFNVYPSDLESVLLRTDGVKDAIALARKVGGVEEVHAVLLLRAGSNPAAIITFANETLSAFQRIRSWTVWPEPDFPRTSLMKVRRDQVQRTLDRMAASPSKATGLSLNAEAIAAEADRSRRVSLLSQYIVESRKEVMQKEGSKLLADFGLSSLDMVALLSQLEQRKGCWLDHPVLPANPTIEDAWKLISETEPQNAAPHLPTRQPSWSSLPLGRMAREIGRPFAIGYWSLFCAKITATWSTDPCNLPTRFVLAAAPHRHWLDAFAICSVLPRKIARHLLIITNRNFQEFFEPSPANRFHERLLMAFAYYAGMPLTFPFTIVPHYGGIREGLFETARWIDRGYCPLSFPKGFAFEDDFPARHDPGPAMLAAECNLPILPVWISGNIGLHLHPAYRRQRVHLTFGAPIAPNLLRTPQQTTELIEASWQAMRLEK